MQVAAGNKETEIRVAPTPRRCLDLRGNVVAGDAMHTQRTLSAQIGDAGGADRWIAKDNHPTLRTDSETVFTTDDRTVAGGHVSRDLRRARTVDKGHGRRETRMLTASCDLHGFSDWPGLHHVFRLERQRTHPTGGTHAPEVV